MKLDYKILFKLAQVGYDVNSDEILNAMQAIQKIKRLAKKHDDIQVMSCNGYGVIRGQAYYNGVIDDYAKREYGQNVKSSYVSDNEDRFDMASAVIEQQIKDITDKNAMLCKFQGDPRGATVKLFIRGNDMTALLY